MVSTYVSSCKSEYQVVSRLNMNKFSMMYKKPNYRQKRIFPQHFSYQKIINIIVNVMTTQKRNLLSLFLQYCCLFQRGFPINEHKVYYKSIIDIIYFEDF